MKPIKTIELEHRGYKIRIEIHHDEGMGPPWEEGDGHGVVTGWECRAKLPGERILCEHRGNKMFYDVRASLKLALKDGWGTSKSTKEDSKKTIAAKAVDEDFEYLRAWCNDEWTWLGYTSEIESPTGWRKDAGSCWGFDDEDDMVNTAMVEAVAEIDKLFSTPETIP